MNRTAATLSHALNIYRDPRWYTVEELDRAVERFVQAAADSDTDAQADEWNALARVLQVHCADRRM